MEKLISIIIPCYNVKKEIDRCINSLVRQTIGIDNLELILVDDASTDGTLDRLYQWEKRFPDSILVVGCDKNGRQGTARNIGLQYASAPWIGYMDADDWAERDMYQTLYDNAVTHGVQVSACQMGRDWGDGNLCDVKEYCGIAEEPIVIRNVSQRHDFLRHGLPGSINTKIYEKKFLLDHDISFPEGLAYEDNYFGALVVYSVERAYVSRKVAYHYYYNPQSTVSGRNSAHQLDRLLIEKEKLKELKRRGFADEFREEMLGSFLRLYYINTLHLIFTRFDQLPYETLEQMKEEVLLQFPDYRQSATYQKLSELEKGFCQSLEHTMTRERWERLAENYRYLIKHKK